MHCCSSACIVVCLHALLFACMRISGTYYLTSLRNWFEKIAGEILEHSLNGASIADAASGFSLYSNLSLILFFLAPFFFTPYSLPASLSLSFAPSFLFLSFLFLSCFHLLCFCRRSIHLFLVFLRPHSQFRSLCLSIYLSIYLPTHLSLYSSTNFSAVTYVKYMSISINLFMHVS